MNFKAQRAEKGFLQQRFVVVENNIPLEFRLYRKQCSRAVQMYRGERINPEFLPQLPGYFLFSRQYRFTRANTSSNEFISGESSFISEKSQAAAAAASSL
ncbi:hypothetical protein [Ruminococcus sp.]|uniref:hypothetical protein n=1 Tax=Ruminococcus sp. TaxID=41978 RepID=UPI0039914EC4